MRRLSTFLTVASTALIATAVLAHAQSGRTQVGVLECRGGASVGFIVGSVTNLGCVLRACSANIDDLRKSLANFIKDNTPQV
ncbi:MAG: DUF992 domain-containing protein, partial [Afipia sp.]|nr:DUF992 domain-containing protein [Afipia sp.]